MLKQTAVLCNGGAMCNFRTSLNLGLFVALDEKSENINMACTCSLFSVETELRV